MACVPCGGGRGRGHGGELLQLLQAVVDQYEKREKGLKRRKATNGRRVRDTLQRYQGPRVVTVVPDEADDDDYDDYDDDADDEGTQAVGYGLEHRQRSDNRSRLTQRRQASAAKRMLQKHVESATPSDVAPAEWDFSEACEYWNLVILGLHDTKLSSNYYAPRVYRPHPKIRCNVILTALSYHISATLRTRGIAIIPNEPPELVGLWTKFFRFMTEAIRRVNEGISQPASEPTVGIFSLIACMLSAEIFLYPTGWRAHLEGFLALIERRGGPDIVVRTGECFPDHLYRAIIYAVMANTTSPPDDQIVGASQFTSAHIHTHYSSRLTPLMPCPTPILLEIIEITRLRVGLAHDLPVAEGRRNGSLVLARINAFSIENWKECYDFPEDIEKLNLAALVFKAAAALYAILSLPLLGSASFPSEHQEMSSRLAYRDKLLQHLRTAWENLSNTGSLAWPLAVAGVALANGPSEHQDFVSGCLDALSKDSDKDPSPGFVLVKLRVFWETGKTRWDDMFDKPMTVLA